MASIKDFEFAMNGEAKAEIVNDGFDNYGHQVANDFVIFKLKGNQKKGVYIDGIDDAINPETGKTERIRLLTGIPSIWMSEQKEVDADYVRSNRRSLEFRGRICRISKMDSAALEFARTCNHNIGNPKRIKASTKFEFYEYDPAKQAEEALKREMLELEMAIKAKEMSDAEIMKYASFIGVQLINELAQTKPIQLVRSEVMLYAKKNPTQFELLVKNPQEVEVQWMVKAAILNNKIDLGRELNAAHWGAGGLICKIPSTQQPLKYLTELAMTNSQEGKEFLKQLKSISK